MAKVDYDKIPSKVFRKHFIKFLKDTIKIMDDTNKEMHKKYPKLFGGEK